MSRRNPVLSLRRSGNVFRDFGYENADVERLTADRLMSMLNRLGARIEVKDA